MDCKDLMVGDWVSYLGFYNKVIYIGQNVSMYDGKGTEFTTDPEHIRPIPLTEENLVKNGFEYERNIGYIFDDYDGNVVIYDDYNNRLKILQNHDVSFNREFFSKVCVHYLQHALRLCEIRKEIEL